MGRRLIRALKLLLRLLLLALLSLAAGACWSWYRSDSYLPTLDGNVWSMLAEEDALFMVLSNGNNNCLVRTDYSGRVLNYANTASNQAYQDLDVWGDAVYAIRSVCERGTDRQEVAAFSTKDPLMRPKVLLDLSSLEGAPGGITWKQIYPPAPEETALRLTGIGDGGQGYLLRWEPETGRTAVERVLEGEEVYFLKYVQEGHYVWIGRDGRANQELHGVRQYDVLSGLAETPYHISTCGVRVFLSDSRTGDIYELSEDGSAALYRRGTAAVGSTGFTYRQMEFFTTQPGPDGTIYPLGFCPRLEGGGAVAGELHAVRALNSGSLRLWMLWEHGWPAAILTGLALLAAYLLISLAFRSRRLFVRLSACETTAALLLAAALIAAQVFAYQEALREGAREKMLMLGGNLAYLLTASAETGQEELEEAVVQVRQQVSAAMGEDAGSYAVSVLWNTPGGFAVGYDPVIPSGYLAESVKDRNYLREVREGFASSGQVTRVRGANRTDYIYVEAFPAEEPRGCVVVSQAEEAILAGRASLWKHLLPILAGCPALFLGLILITRRLLRPLNDIRDALETFYDAGGGNTIGLERMPRTELYEIGRVFNELSVQTRVQFNDLRTINTAYARLVPDCLLQMLGKASVQELAPGDAAGVDGAVLMLLPKTPPGTAAELEAMIEPAADCIWKNNGLIVDHDELLGTITAAFARPEQAERCAWTYLTAASQVSAAVFPERVELGVFGSAELLYPLAVSQTLRRRQAALARLSGFGAVLVRVGNFADPAALRLLGWDGGLTYYEDTALRDSAWQTRWQDARPMWEEAMTRFREGRFSEAMRRFAKALRLLPGDGAVRWYLFRCDDLRGGAADVERETELLFDWRADDGQAPASEAPTA